MTPEDFVKAFHTQKNELIKLFFEENGSAVGGQINAMNLSKEQREQLREILDGSLTDCMYTILLGLDGAGSIGGIQEPYQLKDDAGNELTGGEIEGHAWEYFHGDD